MIKMGDFKLCIDLIPGQVAAKVHDNNVLLAQGEEVKGMAVIPARSNHNVYRCLDWDLYGTRNILECFLGRSKEYPSMAQPYEKRARNYLSTLLLTVPDICGGKWLKRLIESTTRVLG